MVAFWFISGLASHIDVYRAQKKQKCIGSICVELTIAKWKTVISCVYKHPKVPNDVFMKCITKITDSVLCYSSDRVLIRDMNCCPTKRNILRDFCDIYGMTNFIKDATCNQSHVPSLLDVILVTDMLGHSISSVASVIIITLSGLERNVMHRSLNLKKYITVHTRTLLKLILGMTLRPHRVFSCWTHFWRNWLYCLVFQ